MSCIGDIKAVNATFTPIIEVLHNSEARHNQTVLNTTLSIAQVYLIATASLDIKTLEIIISFFFFFFFISGFRQSKEKSSIRISIN